MTDHKTISLQPLLLDTYHEFKDWLEAQGWRRLGSGSYSTAYGHDNADFVVKVSHEWSMESDYVTSNRTSEDLHDYYANLDHPQWMEYFGVTIFNHTERPFAVAFQGRVEREATWDDQDAMDDLYKEMLDAWNEAPKMPHSQFDVKRNNCGWIGGKLYLFDY